MSPGAWAKRIWQALWAAGGIRVRLGVLAVLLVLPVAMAMTQHFAALRAKLVAEKKQDLLLLAKQTSVEIGNSVRAAEHLLHSLGHLSAIAARNPQECTRALGELLNTSSRYVVTLITDAAGTVVCSGDPRVIGTNLADRDYFQQARDIGKFVIRAPLVGRVSGKPTVALALPTRDASGRFSGIVAAGLDLGWLWEPFAQADPTSNVRVSLWAPDGTVLYRWPDGAQWIGQRPAAEIVRAVTERVGETAVMDATGLDGTPKVYAVAGLEKIFGQRVSLTIGVSRQSVTESIDRDLRTATIALGAVMAFGLLLAFVWAQTTLLRPITALTRFSERVAIGNLEALPEAGHLGGEMGDLAKSLEVMRTALKNNRDHLEALVAERTRQLEATNKELEAFSYSVSHDLRSPLRAIDGFTRILQEDYAEKLDDQGRRLLGVVRDNSRKMAELIDDLLEFSRLGRKSLSTTAIDMKRMVEDVLKEVHVAGEQRSELVLKALPPARGDATLLRQAWSNLLDNAIKFSGKRERPVIEVSGHVNGVECVYCVKDNGAGFDMQYYDKLFGVFQRLHRTEEFAGTGVGLAIVQRVVLRHGGRVWAEGKVDEGAAFYFSLPRGAQDG